MNKHKIMPAAAAMLFSLTACGQTAAEQPSEPAAVVTETTLPPAEKNLVTLGDSISYGYGLENPEQQRYSAITAAALSERDDAAWIDNNYAVSGDDSSDLLEKLNNGRALRLPSADKIVLYIGANNLLKVYSEYAAEYADFKQVDPETLSEEELQNLQAEVEADMQDQEQFTAQIQEKIDRNLAQLETDLEAIYQYIRERNDKAEIYVLNLYNPYTADMNISMIDDSAEFTEFAEVQIQRANDILTSLTKTHDELILVDIGAAYAACDTPPVVGTKNAQFNGQQFDYYDPHPDEAGQKLIAETLLAAMGAAS